MRETSLVLLSGGLYSSVALYWAMNRRYKVETLTFNYFLRSRKEILSCRKIAHRAGVRNTVVNLDFLREVETSKKITRNPMLKKAPKAYIHCRNSVFYGIASSLAETLDAKYIIGGHNRDDARTFPDSAPNFFDSFNKTTSLGKISKARTGKVIMPLSALDKSQVVKLGSELGVPFDLTWSCYLSRKKPCGKCTACQLREIAFRRVGIIDPLMVAT